LKRHKRVYESIENESEVDVIFEVVDNRVEITDDDDEDQSKNRSKSVRQSNTK
jgi:hypothetical protein